MKNNSRRNFLKNLFGFGASLVIPNISLASNNILKINNLFLELSKIKELRQTIKSKYIAEKYITIIFIEDVHLGESLTPTSVIEEFAERGLVIERDERWTVEYKQLEILRSIFKINFVGIEGWVGKEIDKKRDFQILNGEETLIKTLSKEKKTNLIGLENEEFQVFNLEFILSIFLWEKNQIEQTLIKFDEFKSIFSILNKNLKEEILKHGHNQKAFNELDEKISNYIFKNREYIESSKFEENFSENMNVITLYIQFLIRISLQIKRIYNFDVNLEEIRNIELNLTKKFSEIFNMTSETEIIKIEKKYNDLIYKKREAFAISKMLKEMQKNNIPIGVIVFGKSHTKNLISELEKQTKGEVNYYVAK